MRKFIRMCEKKTLINLPQVVTGIGFLENLDEFDFWLLEILKPTQKMLNHQSSIQGYPNQERSNLKEKKTFLHEFVFVTFVPAAV